MQNNVTLKDGTKILIRSIKEEDLDKFHAFFQKLPKEDKIFLRIDVTNREILRERIQAIGTSKVERLVATHEEEIVADGVLEREGHGWKEHVGEMRLIVARQFQRRGLGLLMARELYFLAAKQEVDEIVLKMMRPQIAARMIARRLGFQEMVMLPDYVKDRLGKKQDLIVMRCELKALMQELEDYFTLHDWQRTR